MPDQESSRTSHAQNVDQARHSLDQKKGRALKAFRAAQEIRQQNQMQERGTGQSKLQNAPGMNGPAPPRSTGRAVNQAVHKEKLAAARAQADKTARAQQLKQNAEQARNQAQEQGRDRGRG